MVSRTKTRHEYEEQHFNFSSELLLEVSRKLLKDCCDSSVRSAKNLLSEKLLKTAAEPEAVKKAIEEFGESMMAEYSRGVEYGISTVESKIKDCLHIPDNVCLEDDRVMKQVERVDEEELQACIESIKQEAKNLQFICSSLVEEMSTAENAISAMEDWEGVNIDSCIKGIDEL